jgi:hypothetical protein
MPSQDPILLFYHQKLMYKALEAFRKRVLYKKRDSYRKIDLGQKA